MHAGLLDTDPEDEFRLTLTSEGCMTFATCSCPLSEGWCVLQYTLDSSYHQLSSPVRIPLNTRSPLPQLQAPATYYFQTRVMENSTAPEVRATFRTTYTTKKCEE